MTFRSLLLTAAVPFALQAQQWDVYVAPTPPAKPAPAPSVAVSPKPPAQSLFHGDFYQSHAEPLTTSGFNARFPQDPADSLYREARSMLNRGEWRRAASLFGQVASRTPASNYAADALYWQAFALYRIGGVTELRESRTALTARKSRFPRAENTEQADALMLRVNGALAQRGDPEARSSVQSTATSTANGCDSEEQSVRASALSQLMKNDPASATTILSKVLDRRDECSVSLRSNAVMILGRQDDAAARAKLMDVAKNDPATNVRSNAIGYIANANTDEVVNTLDGIVRNDSDAGIQRSAVRALGGMTNPRAKTAIKSLIERSSATERLRIEAISTFDRRAGAASNLSYACSGQGCEPLFATTSGQGWAVVAPTPPTPPTPATPAAAPRPPGVVISEAQRAELAEARATAMADARAAARPMALNLNTDVRSSDDERRISAEDAAWLRGVYPRLESNRLKSAAASVLARARDEATVTWLAQLIQRDDEPAEVRASVLSRLGRELPIAQLGRIYDNAASRTMRTEIVSVLGRRSEPEATDKLIEIVRTSTDPTLRRSAISALSSKKDPRTNQLLLELIDK